MPNEITGLLTKKIGPLPGWAWALGVGGAVFLLGPKLLKGSGATAGATGQANAPPLSYQQGFDSGASYYQAQSSQGAFSQWLAKVIPWPQAGVTRGAPVFANMLDTKPAATIPENSAVTVTGPAVPMALLET